MYFSDATSSVNLIKMVNKNERKKDKKTSKEKPRKVPKVHRTHSKFYDEDDDDNLSHEITPCHSMSFDDSEIINQINQFKAESSAFNSHSSNNDTLASSFDCNVGNELNDIVFNFQPHNIDSNYYSIYCDANDDVQVNSVDDGIDELDRKLSSSLSDIFMSPSISEPLEKRLSQISRVSFHI